MAKNVMNLDQVARGMMPNNHTLLSDEDPMEGTSQQPHNWTRYSIGHPQTLSTSQGSGDNSITQMWKQAKDGGMRTLTSLTNRLNIGGDKGDTRSNPTQKRPSSLAIPTIRESKSLQNLHQLTRGGCNSIAGATNNLVERCNSWVELREFEPKRRNYNELDDEDNEIQRMI